MNATSKLDNAHNANSFQHQKESVLKIVPQVNTSNHPTILANYAMLTVLNVLERLILIVPSVRDPSSYRVELCLAILLVKPTVCLENKQIMAFVVNVR
jgi:hypothetical protein